MTSTQPYTPTSAILIQNNGETGRDFSVVESVTPDGPAVVALGGELTYAPGMANTYAKTLRTLLRENGIESVPIYAAAYEFGSHNSELERVQIFRRAGRKVRIRHHAELNTKMEQQLAQMNTMEPVPNYIIELYDKIFNPRMADVPENHPTANILAARMRGLVIYAHSHGAAVVWQMGKHMRAQLQQLGYNAEEIHQIQRSVLAVQHAPTAPLERPAFTTVSFGSAEDTAARAYNKFYDFLYENSADIVPSFFDALDARVFVAGRLKQTLVGEHDPVGLLDHAKTNETLTEDGKIIFAAQRNVIVNGVRSAMRGDPMPTMAQLANGGIVDFARLQRTGNSIYEWMVSTVRSQNPKHDYQK